MTEQVIQKNIIRMLEKDYGAYVVKVITASKNGIPDLLACVQGRFVGIEVKRPESQNNVSKLQAYNLQRIENSDGISMVAWNTAMVKEVLDELL